MDEARRHKLEIDERRLARDLGIPVVPTTARSGEGLPLLLQTIHEVASGQTVPRPRRIQNEPRSLTVVQRKRLGVQVVHFSFGRFVARRVPRHPHRLPGSYNHGGDARRPRRGGFLSRRFSGAIDRDIGGQVKKVNFPYSFPPHFADRGLQTFFDLGDFVASLFRADRWRAEAPCLLPT